MIKDSTHKNPLSSSFQQAYMDCFQCSLAPDFCTCSCYIIQPINPSPPPPPHIPPVYDIRSRTNTIQEYRTAPSLMPTQHVNLDLVAPKTIQPSNQSPPPPPHIPLKPQRDCMSQAGQLEGHREAPAQRLANTGIPVLQADNTTYHHINQGKNLQQTQPSETLHRNSLFPTVEFLHLALRELATRLNGQSPATATSSATGTVISTT